MRTENNRRDFLKTCLLAGTAGWAGFRPATASAIEPFSRAGAPRLRLSLAAYSFRDTFRHPDPARRITLFDFLDYCANQGLEGAEVTSYYFPESFDEAYLRQLKRHAFLRGISISGSAVGNNFVVPAGPRRDQQIADVKKWVTHCALLGAPHIRVFAGPVVKEMELSAAKKLAITALEECAEFAGRHGIFLGLENHHGIVAEPEDLLDIVKAVNSPWFGINLDTGNFYTDDPYADLARCAPYAVNVQVKMEIRRRAEKEKSRADLRRLIQILRDANYQGWVALEHEVREDPWATVPGYLAELRKLLA